MMKVNQKLDRKIFERRISIAVEQAEALTERLSVTQAPVDPFSIAKSEGNLLRLCLGNYKDAFDGRLEYLPDRKRFLCYVNTKYDRLNDDFHAPRTRFSLAHELGHFFIDSHHEYLRAGGRAHSSRSEYLASMPVEQQADAFAAHLLMPDRFFKPIVNQGEPTIEIIADLAHSFNTSFVSTARRVIECTHFYAAVAALRDNQIAWMWRSDPLIDKGIYPGQKGPIKSPNAKDAWQAYSRGSSSIANSSGWARDWFRIYDEDTSNRLPVEEAYLPAPIMNTLLVLLAIPEDELCDEKE